MKKIPENNENPFSFSIGDLMSALLMIFVLLVSVCIIELNKERSALEKQEEVIENQKRTIAEHVYKHQRVRSQVIKLVTENLGEDLNKWDATFDTTALTICFPAQTAFPLGSAQLNEHFRDMLDMFFPKLINTLADHVITKDGIDEIRIEGHASPEGDYYKNMILSQDRANAVLNYCYPNFKKMTTDMYQLDWVEKKVNSCGMSSSHPIFKDNVVSEDIEIEEVDTIQSRRVQFKLIPIVDIKAIEHAIE